MTDFEEQTGATDIIDATQNAVIDAVNSVSELIGKQTQETLVSESPVTHEVFYLTAEFWVGMAFVLAVLMIFNPLLRALKGLLEKRRNNIITSLTEAENLHLQAQKLLASYERQFQGAKQEIEVMAQQASAELNAYAKEKSATLEKELLKKQKAAENLIQNATDQVRSEMRHAVSVKTAQIVSDYISKNLSATKRSELIDLSIENILNKL